MKTRPPKKVRTLGYFTIAGLIGSFTVVRESDFPFDNSYLNLIPFWICIFFISKFCDWIIAWNELYNYKNTIISKLGLEGKQAEAERKRINAEARLFGLRQLIGGSGDDTRGLGSDGDGGNKGGSNGDGDDSKKDRDDGDESEEEKENRFRKSLRPGLNEDEIDEMRDFMKRADHHLEKIKEKRFKNLGKKKK